MRPQKLLIKWEDGAVATYSDVRTGKATLSDLEMQGAGQPCCFSTMMPSGCRQCEHCRWDAQAHDEVHDRVEPARSRCGSC